MRHRHQNTYRQGRTGPARGPWALGTTGWLLVWSFWAQTAGAVGFPGPVPLPLNGNSLCAERVRVAGADRDYFVSGSGTGFLNLYRFDPTSVSYTTMQQFSTGGRVVAVTPWLGRGATGQGLVVSTVDPDRIVFVAVNDAFPFLVEVAAVDLPEDPGSAAFVGNVTDGPWELAVSLPGVDQVAFLTGGAGGWSLAGTTACGDRPSSLVSLDLDGDAENELVVAQTGVLSGNLGIFRRQAAATYVLQTVDLAGITPSLVAAHDLDGDGRAELAVARADAAEVVFWNEVGGQLVETGRTGLTLIAGTLHLADLPGGEPGLFTGSSERGLLEFASLEGGVWTRRDTYYPGCRPYDIAFADVDADGLDDLIALGGTGNVLSVLLGNDEPGFWGFPAVSLVSSPGSFANADVDNDGYRDLLVSDAESSQLSLFRGTAAGGFELSPQVWDLGFIPGRILSINLDADPIAELAALDPVASELVTMDFVPPAGFVTLSRTAIGPFAFGLESGDLDGDLHADLLVLVQAVPEVNVLFGRGDGTIDEVVSFGFDISADRILPLDLNGDGWLDLVATDGMNRVWSKLNQGGRQFGSQAYVNAGPGALHMAAADLDGDGDDDLVVANRLEKTLSFFENSGTGGLLRRIGGHALPGSPSAVMLADFDGNGRLDVLVNLPDQDKLGLVFGVEDWVYAAATVVNGGPDISGIGIADLNGDGAPDILALDRSLLLGLSLLNVDRGLVAVAATALTAECLGQELQLRVTPDRVGPWVLEVGRGGLWREVMGNGRSTVGPVDYDGGSWVLRLTPADLADLMPGARGGWQGRLTIGAEGDRESSTWVLPGGCGGPETVMPSALAWRGEPWPNPFNPAVSARFSLGRAGQVQAGIYDLAGRLVAVLADGGFGAGEHDLHWDGRGDNGPVAAGVYFLRVATERGVLSRKLMLVK